MKSSALLLFSLLFVSCATVNRHLTNKDLAEFNLPYSPNKDEGIIYVVRPSSLGFAVRFNVFLDDEKSSSEMGWNRGSQYIYFFVKPGEHNLYSVAENTAELKVNVKAGETVFVKQDTHFGFFIARNSLQAIGEVEGKYNVMILNQGNVIQKRKSDPSTLRLPASGN